LATIGNVTVEVGDYVRLDTTLWEGRVTETTDTDLTMIMMADQSEVTVPASECFYNIWDPKSALSGKLPPPP
jgi:hypothetical protein